MNSKYWLGSNALTRQLQNISKMYQVFSCQIFLFEGYIIAPTLSPDDEKDEFV